MIDDRYEENYDDMDCWWQQQDNEEEQQYREDCAERARDMREELRSYR